MKELDETANWLKLLPDGGIVAQAKLSVLQDECNQLLAIFTTIPKKAKSDPS